MNLEQFRDYFAQSIGIKGRGNALAADDAAYLDRFITNCHAELDQLGVALWRDTDIPEYAIESLVDYCRGSLNRFGYQADDAAKAAGLMKLRYLTADPLHGVGKAEYF